MRPWEKGKITLDSSWNLALKLCKTVSGFSGLNVKCLLEFPWIFSLAVLFVSRLFTDKPKVTAGALMVFLIPHFPCDGNKEDRSQPSELITCLGFGRLES